MQALPPQTAGGLAVGTALPSPPGTLGPSPGVPGVSRSIHVHIHTSDPGALIAVPSSSLNSAPRQFSHEELVRIPAGGAGSTLRQFLERADHLIAPQSGAAPNDVGGSARPNRPRNEAADGANQAPGSAPPGPSGMQGALMTVDETGAVRVVPVRFRGGVHPPSGNTVDPLVSRFQQQFFVRPVSNSPNDTPVPAAANPVPPTSTDQSRQTDQASRNTPGMLFLFFDSSVCLHVVLRYSFVIWSVKVIIAFICNFFSGHASPRFCCSLQYLSKALLLCDLYIFKSNRPSSNINNIISFFYVSIHWLWKVS